MGDTKCKQTKLTNQARLQPEASFHQKPRDKRVVRVKAEDNLGLLTPAT
jgi:hypothetical protein